jgi:hypothetical protein
VSPEIQTADLLKAIEMAIPATAIEQAIALDSKRRRTQAIITSTISGKPCNSDEFLVERLNAGCTEELDRWSL